MPQSTVSAELAAQHGLPGLLGLNPHRDHVFVELDLPRTADHIDESVVPGIEALAFGFLSRLLASQARKQEAQVAVANDYVATRIHKDDLDHFLTSLAAIISASKLLNQPR